MLKKKLGTAYRVFREEGLRAVLDVACLRLQLLAMPLTMANRKEVVLDGCTFSLAAVPESATKLLLLTNRYEVPERRAVGRYIRRDLPVVELGGSIGVVACMTNKLLKNPAAHLVVEANPLAIPHLRSNKESNHCEFEIIHRAIAYGSDSVTFRPSSEMYGNSITVPGDHPPVSIETVRLSDLVHTRQFSTFSLVCDIEGLEYDLVYYEGDVLKKADTIILETHVRLIGEEKIRWMMNKLHELGFKVIDKSGAVVVLRK